MSDKTSHQGQQLVAAAERALAQVPPLFPLSQFVAVNPFLGFTEQSFEAAAERIAGVRGRAPLLDAQEYERLFEAGAITWEDLRHVAAPSYTAEQLLSELRAPAEHSRPVTLSAVDGAEKELPEREFRRVIVDEISKVCQAHFDRNQTTWRSPWAKAGLYRAFLEGAVHDATPELQGLPRFRHFVARLPPEAGQALPQLLQELGVSAEHAEDFVHRQLDIVSGWASYCRYLVREQELRGGTDPALRDLLAIRLAYDVALLRAFPTLRPWVGVLRRELLREVPVPVLCRWQAAYERAWQRELAQKLTSHAPVPKPTERRPEVQAVFCIDVRSEPLRRNLEATSAGIHSLGFAGFFGFAVAHERADGAGTESRCPALLVPACASGDGGAGVHEAARRRWDRASAWKAIQNAAASCFSFVETLGAGSAPGLWSLKERSSPTWKARPTPDLLQEAGADVDALAERAAGMLRNASLTENFGRLLLLCGHGSQSANNPYASALDCGACGGHAGDVNARLAARTLNRPDVRARLAERGLSLPSDTWVLAGLHDTMTDEVELFDLEQLPASHEADVARLRAQLLQASRLTRQERAASLGLERHRITSQTLRKRAQHIAEVRPEWGLAGNAALVVAPRATTRGLSLGARCFLHEYRHETDADGSVLRLILAAPVVVASWINLQYYASRVDPVRYGSGNKVLHNVVGGIGVLEGNGGDLRAGLPLQSIHDGQRFVHEPRRLSVVVEAPRDKLLGALAHVPDVKKLFDGGWIHLIALEQGRAYPYSAGAFREPLLSTQGLAA